MSESLQERVARSLTKGELRFLIAETRRREDKLDETREIVTRKAYYVFTLATSVLAVYLASADSLFSRGLGLQLSTVGALVGFLFYIVGAWCFWSAHSTKDYIRVPNPSRLVEELNDPDEEMRLHLTLARAEALIGSGRTLDRIAGTVNIQHDMLIFQIAGLLGSWVFLNQGY